MKRVETMVIEKVLLSSLFGSNPKLSKEYGTNEVTIDFQRNGNGREIVDFLSYNPKTEEFRCYEIKVSMEDFKSKAKKSWVGNYNYLVLSEELFLQKELDWWKKEVPVEVGIIVINTNTCERNCIKKAKFVACSVDKKALKNSLIRTLFYQNQNQKWYLR